LPTSQLVHVSDFAPITDEYFPAEQSMQGMISRFVRNLPAAHCEHSSLLLFVNPTLHLQSCTLLLDNTENEFNGHVTQTSDTEPTVDEYFPGKQAVQG